MKLYHSPGTSSLSAHIALQESGLAFEAIAVPIKTHQLADGTNYHALNPLGYVPLLVLDDDSTLRECAAIVQYVADQVPAKQLAPANGTMARYKLQEWLNFIGTELHKNFSPLFIPGMPDEAKAIFKKRLLARLQWLDAELADRPYLMGENFTVADDFLFTVLSWSKYVGIELSGLARLNAHAKRTGARPAVQATLRAEGLLK